MISSGNLRLIGNQQVADSISNYYDEVKDVGTQTNLNNIAADDCFQYAQNIFKFQYGLHPKTVDKKLITNQPDMLLKYVNKLTEMRITEQYYAQVDLKQLRKNCVNLTAFLRRAYR